MYVHLWKRNLPVGTLVAGRMLSWLLGPATSVQWRARIGEMFLRLIRCYYEIIWLDWRPDEYLDAPTVFLVSLSRQPTLAYLKKHNRWKFLDGAECQVE